MNVYLAGIETDVHYSLFCSAVNIKILNTEDYYYGNVKAYGIQKL